MKKAIIGLLIAAILMTSTTMVLADQGGIPNENACYGQQVSKIYAKMGGMGQWRNNDGSIKNFDWNGDGKTNGQDLAWLINFVKVFHSYN